MARDPRLDAEGQAFLTSVMTLGKTTELPILLTPNELAKLVGVIYKDTEKADCLPQKLKSLIVPTNTYYTTPAGWFDEAFTFPAGTDLVDLILLGIKDITDFKTYLLCLASKPPQAQEKNIR